MVFPATQYIITVVNINFQFPVLSLVCLLTIQIVFVQVNCLFPFDVRELTQKPHIYCLFQYVASAVLCVLLQLQGKQAICNNEARWDHGHCNPKLLSVSGSVCLEITTTSCSWQIPNWQSVVEFCRFDVWSFYKQGVAGISPHGALCVSCSYLL